MALTKDERAWAIGEINRIMDEDGEYCVDRHCVADIDDDAEMHEFNEIAFYGCCGSFERKVVHPETGKHILIGCNYGH